MTISTRTLVQIAGWGGLIVSSTGFYLQHLLVDRVRNYDYYKNALKKLRTHPGALHYLGEPIKDRRFKLSDQENNFSDGSTARFRIPVSGPKDKEFVMMNPDFFIGTAREKFFYHNTLLSLVRGLENKCVTVDLRNDAYVCGKIISVDGYMNLSFSNAVYCDSQGNEFSFENLFIQARNVRYVHIPETMSIISTIKSELCKKIQRTTTKKLTEKSRKVKKALQRHMETVASLNA